MNQLKNLHKKIKGKNDYKKSLVKLLKASIATVVGLGAVYWAGNPYWGALTPLLLWAENFYKHR